MTITGKLTQQFLQQTAIDYDLELCEVERIEKLYPITISGDFTIKFHEKLLELSLKTEE